MFTISGLGDIAPATQPVDQSGTATFCANNPMDPLCNNGSRPGGTGTNTFLNSRSTWIPAAVQEVRLTPGAAAPTAGTQVVTATGQAPGGGLFPQAGGSAFMSFGSGWYMTWWGLLLIAGLGYGAYYYYNKSKKAA